jgi:uncharacterized repeat protein (TIGR03803 family)
MNKFLMTLLRPSVLAAGLSLTLAARATAQAFTTLYSFSGVSAGANPANSDGTEPLAGLILSSNILYGTAFGGGSSGYGAVFAITTNGTGFTNLYSFTGGGDEGNPESGSLILSSNALYGTTHGDFGPSPSDGTVFTVNTDGSGFTTLYSFADGNDGANPRAGLILMGNALYGTTAGDFVATYGSVFAVNTDGSGFTTLHNFSGGDDGAWPYAGVILSSKTLYGTTSYGGTSSNGTVFAVNVDGTGFTNLYSFTATPAYPLPYTNGDGAGPRGGLILSGNRLYGTTDHGGYGNGTLFALNTDGTDFRNLHTFSVARLNASLNIYTNSDGASPQGGLILSGDTLYGTAGFGGPAGDGTIFQVNTNGTHFVTLHGFTAISAPTFDPFVPGTNRDGAAPYGTLMLSGNTLYGTAKYGGNSGYGTVFSLALPVPPQLSITPSGANVILTWPTNAGFTLQSTTNLTSPAWITTFPAAVFVNGLNTVTNPVSATQQFFRLSH